MKSPTLIITLILLLLNVLFGYMMSSYGWVNVSLTSLAIIGNCFLMFLVSAMSIKDGFRVSFNCLFPLFTLIEIWCGIAAPNRFEDNGQLVAIIILIFIQILLLVGANAISKSVE